MAKVRTTIVLPEEDIKLIKMLALSRGITMSEVILESVRMRIGQKPRSKADPKRVFGSIARPKGFKGIYKKRSELYEERLKKQFPSYRQ